MTKLKSLFAREPVRLAVYTLAVAVAGSLVASGAVSGDAVDYVLASVAALLSVPAAEVARSQVSPTSKV